GIRDKLVTGVQTCALPISHPCHLPPGEGEARTVPGNFHALWCGTASWGLASAARILESALAAPTMSESELKLHHERESWGRFNRSEERRVGKEGRFWVTAE